MIQHIALVPPNVCVQCWPTDTHDWPEIPERPCVPQSGWASSPPDPWPDGGESHTSPTCVQLRATDSPILLVFGLWRHKNSSQRVVKPYPPQKKGWSRFQALTLWISERNLSHSLTSHWFFFLNRHNKSWLIIQLSFLLIEVKDRVWARTCFWMFIRGFEAAVEGLGGAASTD